MRCCGESEMLVLQFHPGKFRCFHSAPVSTWTNNLVPLNEIWGSAAEELTERLWLSNDVEIRKNLITQFLANKCLDTRPSLIDHAINQIISHAGAGKIGEIARQHHLSVAHFRSRFKNEVGLSPKEFQRITRINAVLKCCNELNNCVLTELTYRFGYFDQSHFIRDFTSYLDMTPKSFFREYAFDVEHGAIQKRPMG